MKIERLEDFIKNMPQDIEGIVPKARHLYLELGKRSFYDPEYKYFMFGEENDNYIYVNKPYSNPNIIMCTTLAKQYLNLLLMAGISSSIEIEDGGDHWFNTFTDEHSRSHTVDITQDLKNIQFGCNTNYFATETITPEELRAIDIGIGYISKTKGYSDEYWYIVRDAIRDERLSAKARLEIALSNIEKFGDIKSPGIVEMFSIYQKFIKYVMPPTDNISVYSMKTNQREPEKCIIELKGDSSTVTKYILNPKTRKFEEVIEKKNEEKVKSGGKKLPDAPNEDGR